MDCAEARNGTEVGCLAIHAGRLIKREEAKRDGELFYPHLVETGLWNVSQERCLEIYAG